MAITDNLTPPTYTSSADAIAGDDLLFYIDCGEHLHLFKVDIREGAVLITTNGELSQLRTSDIEDDDLEVMLDSMIERAHAR